MTSSLRLDSLAARGLDDICVFSALHVMFFPLSSGLAVSFTSDVVTFLSSEIWNKFKLMWLHQTPPGCQFPLTFIWIKWKIWKCKTRTQHNNSHNNAESISATQAAAATVQFTLIFGNVSHSWCIPANKKGFLPLNCLTDNSRSLACNFASFAATFQARTHTKRAFFSSIRNFRCSSVIYDL